MLSETTLKIPPAKPNYQPANPQIQEAASCLLSAWAEHHPRLVYTEEDSHLDASGEIVIQVVTHKVVEFVGGPFDTIRCPHCGTLLDDDWWGDAVTQAFETKFQNLFVRAPCCGKEASLNDLAYDPPAVGFARFYFSVRNPFREIERTKGDEHGPGFWVRLEPLAIDADTLTRIGVALGCQVRVIWVRI